MSLFHVNFVCMLMEHLFSGVQPPKNVKGTWSDFSEWSFYSNNESLPKKSCFQISIKLVKLFGCMKREHVLQLSMPCCVSWIIVTITSHIFSTILQTVFFSPVKFTRSKDKKISFLLMPKSQNVWTKSEAIRAGSFNTSRQLILVHFQT